MPAGPQLRAVLSLALLASACAPNPIESVPDAYWLERIAVSAEARGRNPDLPDDGIVRAAFLRPIMNHCDEFACEYDLPRLFRVRALACVRRPDPSGEAVRCRYERQLISRSGEAGAWHRAETDLMRYASSAGGGWFVLDDRTPQEDVSD